MIDAHMVVKKARKHKHEPLKPPEWAYAKSVTTNMQKDNILPILQKGAKHLEKTHVMNFSVATIHAIEDIMIWQW